MAGINRRKYEGPDKSSGQGFFTRLASRREVRQGRPEHKTPERLCGPGEAFVNGRRLEPALVLKWAR